ncbi:Ig-like domain-containing protein, partial [Campylobacter jejuni]
VTDAAGNEIGTTTVGDDGSWSVPVSQADVAAMGEGAETITATETDAAGNSSSTSADISVDTVAPDSNALTITTPIA